MKFSFLSVALIICMTVSSTSAKVDGASTASTAPHAVQSPPVNHKQLRLATMTNVNAIAAVTDELDHQHQRRDLWFDDDWWNFDLSWDDDWWNFDLGWDDDWWNIDLDWDEIVSNLQNIDWNIINWGNHGAWAEWLEDWRSVLPDDFGVCSIVETALGMTGEFVENANCQCVGDIFSGIEIDCAFRGCAWEDSDDETCGSVQLGFGFGGTNDGQIDVNACADMEDDWFEQICFGYGIDVTKGFEFDPASQTCEAKYGDQACDSCTIDENFCLSLDCSNILEFLKTDTCQALSFSEGLSMNAFVPDFEAFRNTNVVSDEEEKECVDKKKFIWKENTEKKCAKWVPKKLKENENFCNKKTSEGIKIGDHCPATCGLC